MCFTNQPPIELTLNSNDQWTAGLTAHTSSDYRIELTDRAGRKGGNEAPYHLVVVPDEPPQVDIVDPQADVRAAPTNKVPLRISASDDFAVSGIKLVFHKLGEPEKAVICDATNLNEPEATARAEIDLTPLNLQPYELVAYHAEASDNNTLDGPGIGKSPVYFIEVTTNDEPVSESHSQGQKINLLQLEKQIIAATTAAPEERIRETLPKVAAVQRQTRDYAETFKNTSPVLAAAPPQARVEFDAALNSMAGAITSLDQLQSSPALASEEDALKHLYQAAGLFPELKPCMCNCTGIKIVAEAIEKKKKEEQKKREQELPKVIAQARKVAAAQAQLNGLYRKSAGEAPSRAAQSNSPRQGQNASGGRGEPSRDGNAPATNPPAVNQDEAETTDSRDDGQKQFAAAPSEEQKKLAEQASELAAKLRELAGSDPRVSSRHSQRMSDVASDMRRAGDFLAANNSHAAEDTGRLAWNQLEEIVGALEVLSNDQPHASEAAAEQYPKEYGQQISDYLRALSYQK
jgi:hypothetical protein